MGVTVLGTRISQFEVSPTWLRLGASDRMVLCSCPSPSFVLSHIFVLLMLRKRRRGRGKECRMKDSFCSLQNIRHVRREGEGFPRLPGARLADWIKECFLYNDARECSLKGDSKCALHMWRQHSLSVWPAAELQLQPDQQWLNNEKSSLNKIGSHDKWICLELGFWGITEHKNDFNAKISSY